MSNPSFSNIDQWFFELQEGNLSSQQVAQLKLFILQHPELEVDKDMWELAFVKNTPLSYPNKQALTRKRPVIFYWTASSAAIIVLSLGLISLFSQSEANAYGSISRTSFGANNLNSEESIPSATTIRQAQTAIENQLYHSFITPTDLNVNTIGNFVQNERNTENSNPNSTSIVFVSLNETTSESSSNLNSQTNNQVTTYTLSPKRNFYFAELNRENTMSQTKKEDEIADWKLHRKSVNHSNHSSHSFSSKMRLLRRTIERMVDNPVALKNLKDPHYHVPGMQAVDVNFGAVGTLLATRVQTTSRYQWMGSQNEQLSNQLLIDGYSYAMRGGIGLQVVQSNYHDNSIQKTFAAVTYSPKFSVSKNVTVEPAIRFKMGNNRINPNAFDAGQSIEFERNNPTQFYSDIETQKGKSLWFKDLGASVMVNTKWFFAGAQFDNLTRHESNIFNANSNERSSIHTVFTLGTDYESMNKNLRFSPYFIYQNYGKLSEAWLGTNFGVKWFNVGAAVSSNIEPAASIGVKFKHFALTYNADLTRSAMTSKNALSHQLTLRFNTKPSRIGQRLLNY